SHTLCSSSPPGLSSSTRAPVCLRPRVPGQLVVRPAGEAYLAPAGRTYDITGIPPAIRSCDGGQRPCPAADAKAVPLPRFVRPARTVGCRSAPLPSFDGGFLMAPGALHGPSQPPLLAVIVQFSSHGPNTRLRVEVRPIGLRA